MGCSPYFSATGTHSILPLDIAETTYLLPLPADVMPTTDLITIHAIALQKRWSHLANLWSCVMLAHLEAVARFEKDHAATIRDFDFQRCNLVLVQNTAIEKSLNCKMHPQYLGPLIDISHNRGGAYIICKLDSAVFDRPIATFHVIPYFAQWSLTLLDLESFLDILASCLHKLQDSVTADPEADESAASDILGNDAVSYSDVQSSKDDDK